MNDPFANSGFLVINDTSVHDLSDDPIQGFTPVGGAAVIDTDGIAFPSARNGSGYRGDAGIIGLSLAEGVFYPIPATSIKLASGAIICWRD